mgnify:CR=1 FL=1
MVKMKTGTVVYVNRWPERLDLLELVYYPIVMIILAECGSIHLQMYGLHDGWSHPAGKKDDASSASWRQESAERIQSVLLAGRHIQYSDFVAE